MPKSKVAAGFVIFRRFSQNIEYLLMQTSYGEHHWTPPKGHVDKGETDEMVTAYRETEEESGLLQSDLKVYEDSKKVLEYPVKGVPKKVVYWVAELINPRAEVRMSDEHQAFEWLQIDDACRTAKYDDMQGLLRSYHEFISKLQ